MADFLLEIGVEEMPARMIAVAEAELLRRVITLLERERLLEGAGAPRSFSTPRRLAVLVAGVREQQDDVAEELLGPSAKIAFKDGGPGPAAEAFARKAGVAVEALRVVATPKGDYLAATSTRPGQAAATVLAAELPKELAAIAWAKTMHWRAGKPERFVRPVRWLVALLGEAVVPVEFAGCTAGRTTRGHRVLGGGAPDALAAPAGYPETLRAAFVEPEVEARRHTIRKALDRVCRELGLRAADALRWREDHALVDKMTHLTEWPSVIAGQFDPAYLELPEEVLVTVMRDHQNYFAVEDSAGKLAPHFLAVLNTATDAAGEAVIRHGNERVLRARFNDARFFWEFDQRTPLADRAALLENVTFQKDLGSYAAKSMRVAAIARTLGEHAQDQGMPLDLEALAIAARLAKTDLTTELVKEFTELQGQVGGLYARAQGYPEAACAAIYDQYRPASMEDHLPRTPEGQLLGLADRIDTIVGLFGLGLEPTGSKDPFALRRAANAIVRVLGEAEVPLTLSNLVAASGASTEVAAKGTAFFAERLDFYLREAKGQAYDVVKAVLAAGADDVRDAVVRAEAVTAVRDSDDFRALAAAFKRMKNILAQAPTIPRRPGEHLSALTGADEALRARAREVLGKVDSLRDQTQFEAALRHTATLRPDVDRFFEQVMVMDPDLDVRRRRLLLLQDLVDAFSTIADLSEIVVAG